MLRDPAKEAEIEKKLKENEARSYILKAAQVLRDRGWCQGRFEDPWGAVCLAGAVNVALTGRATTMTSSPLSYQIFDLLLCNLRRTNERDQGLCQAQGLSVWNDDVATSIEEVISFLEETAERA